MEGLVYFAGDIVAQERGRSVRRPGNSIILLVAAGVWPGVACTGEVITRKAGKDPNM